MSALGREYERGFDDGAQWVMTRVSRSTPNAIVVSLCFSSAALGLGLGVLLCSAGVL